MTQAFRDLLYLLRCAVQEEETVKLPATDVPTLLQLAQQQQIALIIFPVLKKLYEQGVLAVPAENFAMLEESYVTLIMEETRRRYAISQTAAALEKAGFDSCLLKGVVVADLYPVSEARVSGDADFYIDARCEKELNRFMKEQGFEVLYRPNTSHHAMCKSKATGLIEFHLSLYDALFEDVWFNHPKLAEPYRMHTTADGYSYTTLGITDHAIFLTLHLIKHFLSEGVGIRQLTDVLLYLRHYQKELNAKAYAKFFADLDYAKFIGLCMSIGINYLGFVAEDFAYITDLLPVYTLDEDLMSAFLTDTEQGGVFGHNDDSRKRFYVLYTQARFERFKEGSFEAYIEKWHHKTWREKLFPPMPVMKARFPMLRRYPILLPYFYGARIIGKYVLKKGKQAESLVPAEEHKRMELIRKLDMI